MDNARRGAGDVLKIGVVLWGIVRRAGCAGPRRGQLVVIILLKIVIILLESKESCSNQLEYVNKYLVRAGARKGHPAPPVHALAMSPEIYEMVVIGIDKKVRL